MILVAWDGWKPLGYTYGWIARCLGSSERVVVVETVYVLPQYRGRKTISALKQFVAKVDHYCRTRGIARLVTRIEKSRPEVLRAGIRWGAYVPYAEEGKFTWCYRDIPSTERVSFS